MCTPRESRERMFEVCFAKFTEMHKKHSIDVHQMLTRASSLAERERQDSGDAIGEEQDVGELADAAVEEEMR